MSLLAAAPALADESRARRAERAFERPMLAAALLVIPVVVIESTHVSQRWQTIGQALNWAIWAAFALELVTMLVVSPQRRAWLRAHPLELAIVVLTPPFLPASLQTLRLFRLLRLLRLLVIVPRLRQLVTVNGVKFAALTAIVAALGGGAIFAQVENRGSTWDGVYWALTTMATVGYGDLAPHTAVGRTVAILLMLIGVSCFALVTGAVAQLFLAGEVREVETFEAEVAGDVASVRGEIAAELRELSERLRKLEQQVEKL